MIALGYLLALAAGGLIVALARLQLTRMPGGDAGVGHAWAMLGGHAALLAILLALTAVVAIAGRLPATPVAGSWRALPALLFVLVSGAAAASAAAAAPTSAVAPWSPAAATRLLPLLVPLLLTVAAGLLLRGPTPGPWPTRLLGLVALQAAAFALVLALPSVGRWVDGRRAAARRDPSALDAFQRQALADADSLDPATQLARLLALTRDGNHPTIRQRALARIRTLPEWETRVADVLAGPDADAAFVFLASHDVSDPAPYARAAAAGVRAEAARVRARIRNASHPSHLYAGLMVFEVDAILGTLTRLSGAGVDHAPALRELRAAFDEPAPWPHPRYRAVDAIDRWLRTRR
ncbi:hypothetical protein [Roseisolibacter sp. H3M3-2]|uniref:hypothetical protein n=1 Tax=Roseisolibacter sp. H3M3-2 TaxID=3031323 RepID=UPI0023DAA007|nr:hypothetical protein [Roseisolibacter sp. H3M3-2]MDF1502776.1 hypothetical protein [Roseisolibacter sp. H3M3-2]